VQRESGRRGRSDRTGKTPRRLAPADAEALAEVRHERA
jgi:hypothetical protein